VIGRGLAIARLATLATLATWGGSACTQVATDANAVVALRFEGAAYPSIVAGDSLRDSLGVVQPLVATALNFRNEPVPDAPIEFASPDSVLRVSSGGRVFVTRHKPDTALLVFASTGTLQSQPDTLFTVFRADSISADSVTMTRPVGARLVPDSIGFNVFVPGTGGGAAAPGRSWLVSFQLRLNDKLLDPTDTTAVYTFTGQTNRRVRSFIDTTDASGSVSRGLVINCQALAATGPDSVIVIATTRDRRPGTQPKRAQTVVRLQRGQCP
jgi:hypothetical protein